MCLVAVASSRPPGTARERLARMQPSSSGARAGPAAPAFDVTPAVHGRPARTGFARPLVAAAERQPADPILLVQSVTKRWPRQPQPVLRDIDLRDASGGARMAHGSNGAGKTTLLRIIAGLLAPDSGPSRTYAASTRARAAATTSARSACSAPATAGSTRGMTVRQHLDYWARLALVAPRARRERVDESHRALRSRGARRTAHRPHVDGPAPARCGSRWRSCTVRAWSCSTSRRRASTTMAARCSSRPSPSTAAAAARRCGALRARRARDDRRPLVPTRVRGADRR